MSTNGRYSVIFLKVYRTSIVNQGPIKYFDNISDAEKSLEGASMYPQGIIVDFGPSNNDEGEIISIKCKGKEEIFKIK